MDNKDISRKPSLKEKKTTDPYFNLADFTMTDFRVFLILLIHSGEELSVLSKVINAEFNLKSRTEGYNYINRVCEAGYAYKRKGNVNEKRVSKVYVSSKTRAAYNDLFAPTIECTRKVLKEVVKDYLKEFNNIEQMRQKLVNLSENTIKTVRDLIARSSPRLVTSERFIEKLSNEIRAACSSELFILEMYSKRFQT